jgi:ferredoxin
VDPRIEVERDLCIGAENCVRVAGGAFDVDQDGMVMTRDPFKATDEELERAARGCPSGAIRYVTVVD